MFISKIEWFDDFLWKIPCQWFSYLHTLKYSLQLKTAVIYLTTTVYVLMNDKRNTVVVKINSKEIVT